MFTVQVSLLVILIIHLCVTNSREVYMRNVSELLGTDGIDLRCSYTTDQGDIVVGVDFLAMNDTDSFVKIAESILVADKPRLLPYGEYLFGSANITKVRDLPSEVLLSFNDLKCKHERNYRCILGVYNKEPIFSAPIEILVQVSPSKPDNIVLLNRSLTSKPVINEGCNVSFICSGDVGKPPKKFIFRKYRSGHNLYIDYTATETSILELPDNCSYYRTSSITLQVTAEDNQAVIRCAVVSSLAEENMYVESEPLYVKFAVKIPTIVKHPNKTDYLVGLDNSISLNCKTNGNPKPNYLWYKDNQIEAISTRETFTIANVITTNSGIYTCIVSNSFNDVIYTKRVQMHVSIIKEANEASSTTFKTSVCIKAPVIKQSNNENTAVIVVGTVCGSIILVLCVILFAVLQNKNKTFRCFLRRNRNDRSVDYVNTIQQQDPSLYEGVGHSLDVHNYEQLSRREHLYNNANLSNN